MSSRQDFGKSFLILENEEILKQLRAAEIDKVTLKVGDITESEAARAVRREMLRSSRGCSGSIEVTQLAV